jgi:hypothetical protein
MVNQRRSCASQRGRIQGRMRKLAMVGIMAGVLTFCLLPSLATAAAALQWRLAPDQDVTPGWADRIMYKDQGAGGGAVTVADVIIPAGGASLWRADEAALVNVTFGSAPWEGRMTLNEANKTVVNQIVQDMLVDIGYVDVGGFVSVGQIDLGGALIRPWGAFYTVDITCPAGTFSVPKGAYLALRVTNGAAIPAHVMTGEGDSGSWIKSPADVPNYPLPEVSALALMGMGVVGLGAYTALNRRKAARAARRLE